MSENMGPFHCDDGFPKCNNIIKFFLLSFFLCNVVTVDWNKLTYSGYKTQARPRNKGNMRATYCI